MRDLIGTTIMQYEILEFLGRGAMGAVYKALDTQLNTYRALKFILPGHASAPEARTSLQKEAHNQSKLIHQNIAAILGYNESEAGCFLVMEYIQGTTLDALILSDTLSVSERMQVILQVTYAIEAAHRAGLL
ncbi:protein kinase, partial [Gemmatimonadota bacterium]